jgi:hypothetical protein
MLAGQGVEIRPRASGEIDGIDLVIDGLPSYLASTGRRVHASALLAFALRALAALEPGMRAERIDLTRSYTNAFARLAGERGRA